MKIIINTVFHCKMRVVALNPGWIWAEWEDGIKSIGWNELTKSHHTSAIHSP